jgi:hypothetical protein
MIQLVSQKQTRHFQTLSQAIAAGREITTDKSRTIILPDGDYFLEETIELNWHDSNLTIKAEASGRAHLIGGRHITGWQPKDGRLWAAPLPQAKTGEWDFRLLVVNGRLAQRSRLPESGYFLHDTEFNVKWLSTVEGGWERPATDDELLTLNYRPQDIGPWFDPQNAEMTIFHMWDESLVGVADFDPAHHTIRFSNKPGYPPGAFSGQYDMERRYVIWNLKEGLHNPGQWYVDRTHGQVIYWPLPDEDMRYAVILAPTMESVVHIEGTPDQPVENITVDGLALSMTNAPRKTGAFGAKLFDGAISIKNAKKCTLKNLHIQNVAAHAIKAECDRLNIENCELDYTGASAIRATGANIRIHNNYIHHVGQIFPSAIAVYVGMTDPNVPEEWKVRHQTHSAQITHNELHDTPYTAIACGGSDHIIDHNLIYRAMQDLYDGAGIYITFCENVRMRGNVVRDIKKSAGAGTSAYYMDEKTINSVLDGNICIDVARPMHNHISNNNTICNNVFIMPGAGYYTLERSSDYTFEKNILMSDDEFAIYDIRTLTRFENNIFFCRNGMPMARELDQYQITKSYPLPLAETNRECDPKIKIDENGNVSYAQDSPIKELGILPLDVSKAGRVVKKSLL